MDLLRLPAQAVAHCTLKVHRAAKWLQFAVVSTQLQYIMVLLVRPVKAGPCRHLDAGYAMRPTSASPRLIRKFSRCVQRGARTSIEVAPPGTSPAACPVRAGALLTSRQCRLRCRAPGRPSRQAASKVSFRTTAVRRAATGSSHSLRGVVYIARHWHQVAVFVGH